MTGSSPHIELFRKYLDGKCTREEILRLYRYFGSSSNEEELRRMITDSLQREETVSGDFHAVTEEIFRKLKEDIRKKSHRQNTFFTKRFVVKAAIAASVALTILSAAVWYRLSLRDGAFAGTEVVADTDRTREVLLADGSVVWLNGGSRLTYPEPFRGEVREVFLEGEAFFEIKPDSLRPFVVRSGDIMTRVLGTSFNVRKDEETGDVEIGVRTGKIQVTRGGRNDVLAKGNAWRYDGSSGKVDIYEINTEAVGRWRSGAQFHFRDQTLGSVVSQLESHFGAKIRYPAGIKDCYVHADFKSSDPLEKILFKLVLPLEGDVRKTGENEYALSGDKCQ